MQPNCAANFNKNTLQSEKMEIRFGCIKFCQQWRYHNASGINWSILEARSFVVDLICFSSSVLHISSTNACRQLWRPYSLNCTEAEFIASVRKCLPIVVLHLRPHYCEPGCRRRPERLSVHRGMLEVCPLTDLWELGGRRSGIPGTEQETIKQRVRDNCRNYIQCFIIFATNQQNVT